MGPFPLTLPKPFRTPATQATEAGGVGVGCFSGVGSGAAQGQYWKKLKFVIFFDLIGISVLMGL